MIAEVQHGKTSDYRFVHIDMGEPVCGEDFCDGCGDCLDCQYHGPEEWCQGWSSRWVIYDSDEKHPRNLPVRDPRRLRFYGALILSATERAEASQS